MRFAALTFATNKTAFSAIQPMSPISMPAVTLGLMIVTECLHR